MSSAITGATSPKHVISNVEASEITLDAATLEEIEKILNNTPQGHPVYQAPW